jgi:hypothetical protein
MWMRRTIVLVAGLFALASPAWAQDFRIQEVSAARDVDVTHLAPGTIAFSDQVGAGIAGPGADAGTKALIRFGDWAIKDPVQKKFLSLYPGYAEPVVRKLASSDGAPATVTEKLYMYVAQARFVLDRPPGQIDLSRYVTLAFLQRIDPAIKHTQIPAVDPAPFKGEAQEGNDNPERTWCTGRTTLICLRSSYKLEGKIPIGILLVNKIRDSGKKISDHIDFESEFSAQAPADLDQAGLTQLTTLDAPLVGVLEQNLFYVNEIMKFGKFLAVFQNDPADAGKTVATAFMALAIKASVLDERRGYENTPVLRNLVPAQVLMGQSSFNSGNSISAGLPKYARNEISTIAGIMEHDK